MMLLGYQTEFQKNQVHHYKIGITPILKPEGLKKGSIDSMHYQMHNIGGMG